MEAQKEALEDGACWRRRCRRSLVTVEPPQLADDQAPVRTCHRYLTVGRPTRAIVTPWPRDLPIGSGEIESAHRYIAQKRLKLPRSLVARRARRRHARPARHPYQRRLGRLFGASAAKTARPQIKTAPPYHKNPQHDCITLDRTLELRFPRVASWDASSDLPTALNPSAEPPPRRQGRL